MRNFLAIVFAIIGGIIAVVLARLVLIYLIPNVGILSVITDPDGYPGIAFITFISISVGTACMGMVHHSIVPNALNKNGRIITYSIFGVALGLMCVGWIVDVILTSNLDTKDLIAFISIFAGFLVGVGGGMQND